MLCKKKKCVQKFVIYSEKGVNVPENFIIYPKLLYVFAYLR